MSIDDRGLISWQPTATQFGDNNIKIKVSDDRGGFDIQEYTVKVVSFAANQSPKIDSTPNLTATVSSSYQYNLAGSDPDGDLLLWSLDSAPRGMSIDPERGTIRWTPTADQVGEHEVAVRVMDSLGAYVGQAFTVKVRGVNVAPTITSTPPTAAAVNKAYKYVVLAKDLENDKLQFSLHNPPSGMTINRDTGLIEWIPTAGQVGEKNVEVIVEDSEGATTKQNYKILVKQTAENLPPAITSTPKNVAAVNQNYRYAVTATDPEGETPLIQLLEKPDGMTFNQATGQVEWKPNSTQTGVYSVTIAATDSSGAGGVQQFDINVVANQSPQIISTPVESVTLGKTYRYDVKATDGNGDALVYSLTNPVEGMEIDSLGRITWSPSNTGAFPVNITVTDSRGASVSQTYNLNVVADNTAPKVSLRSNRGGSVDKGDEVSFVVSATDDVGVTATVLKVNNRVVPLDSQGRATVKMDTAGVVNAVATATDAAGNSGNASNSINVIDPSDNVGPDLEISSLEDDAIITAPIDIIGTVNDSSLSYYRLLVSPVDGGEFREVFRGTSQVTNGVLGKFDPSVLGNDSYILKLEAADAGGNISSVERVVNVAGELKLGNFRLSFTDLEIPVAGIPINVTRTYDSLNANSKDDFGYGWRLEFRDTDLRTSLKKDEVFEQLGVRTVAFKDKTRVYITLPGGKREAFTFKPTGDRLNSYFSQPEAWIYHPAFEGDKGVTSKLTVEDTRLTHVGNEYFGLNGEPYNPADSAFGGKYVLTTKEGIVYEIDGVSGDLLTATDTNGNKLRFTDAGIFSDSGKAISFGRDAAGRIVSVTDLLGKQVKYQYDAKGDLVGVTDRENNTTQFVYNQPQRTHFLTEVIDPLGRRGVKNEYDDSGRLKKLFDASNNAVELIHDPNNFVETVKDVFGKATTYEYDSRGNVVTEIDPLGKVTKRTYDDDNYTLSETVITEETGVEGWKTEFTYDGEGNKLTEKDPLGNITRYTYGAFGRLLTDTDPLGNTTTNRYDKRGNLLSITDADRNTTKYQVNAKGDLSSIIAPNGGAMNFEYDEFGNQKKIVDPLNNVTTTTFDANGNIKTQTRIVTTPTGEIKELITKWTYDNEGREKSITDTEGRTTEYQYDERGLRTAVIVEGVTLLKYRYNEKGEWIETIYPDGTLNNDQDNRRVGTRFDKGGRKVASIDAAGRTTHYNYDDAGHLVQIIYPDGTPDNEEDNPKIITEYDKTGRVKAQIDERGNRTEYRYNPIGQIIETIHPDDTPDNDEDNPRANYEYDKAGRRISETDALGRTTKYVYDEVGRLTETKFHDKTSIKHTYNELGFRVTTTDQANVTTEFRYNKAGQLTAIKNAREDWHEYGYDEMSRLIWVKDANQQKTKYEYDGEGRLMAVELSTGERSTTTYDELGRIKNKTDFNGDTITYEYDNLNRLRAKHLPNDTITYTYTPSGQIETITNALGEIAYTYDERDRIKTVTNTDGVTISYKYDASGNRTEVTIPSGTTTYSYDERNRLETVSNPNDPNALTTYFYDKVGNLQQIERPNGTVENRQYDDLNRLKYLENIGLNGEVISKYAYILDPVGNRKAIKEKGGRSVKYTYDNLYRLEKEEIIDPVNSDRTITYTYDAVGNRLLRNDSLLGQTNYLYDDNHRLEREITNGVTTTYQYDDNGSLTFRSNSTEQIAYNWSTDGENRLMEATITNSNGTTNLEYKYDSNGARIASIVNGEKTRYLIDSNLPYAQVLEEYNSNGILQSSYTYGNGLISTNRSGQEFFYLTDGLGSTRLLTNAQGIESASYHYDGYGQILAETGIDNNYLFAGEQRDRKLGLDYLRARYYNPSAGRFISQDAFAGIQNDSMSQHKYLYAHANPVNYIDPSGHFSLLSTIGNMALWQKVLLGGIGTLVTPFAVGYGISAFDHFTPANNDNSDEADGVMYTLQQGGAAFWGHTLLKAAGGYWNVAGGNDVIYDTQAKFYEFLDEDQVTAYRHDLLMSSEEEEEYKQNFQQWVYDNAADERTKNKAFYNPLTQDLRVPYDIFSNNCVTVTIKNLPDSVKAKKHIQGHNFPPFLHFSLNWLSHRGIVRKLKTRAPG